MKLYGTPFSPRYRRVAIAAAELGVALDLVELNIPKGDNRAPEYLAKNPMGKVPTLEEDDGWTLWESFAMLAYLGEKYADRQLFPSDARGRADALRWMFWSSTHFDPPVATLYAQKVLYPLMARPVNEALVTTALQEVQQFLPVLEAHLRGRTWILGERFSLVDVGLGASADALLRKEVGFDRATFPNVSAWHARLVERPSWSAGSKR